MEVFRLIMKNKVYLAISIIGTILLLVFFAGVNIYVDPLFHYHGATTGLQYPLYNERYMNDGITRNFMYDSIITGTSMTENFKTSLWDSLFDTNSIKVPFSGGTYKEINGLLDRAFKRNDYIKMVLCSLDLNMLIEDKDSMDYEDYPEYLYDDNIFNDVNYVLNKDIFFTFTEYVFTFNKLGGNSTDFDTYKNWNGLYEYNEEVMRANHIRGEKREKGVKLTEEESAMIKENLDQNVISLVKEHPETQFYFFIPPYSICYWDDLYRKGEINKIIEAQRVEIELLLPYKNIHLYSFFDNEKIICNLNLYRDSLHYNQEVSDMIMESIYYGAGQITGSNYEEYLNVIEEFYTKFPYDDFFNEKSENIVW